MSESTILEKFPKKRIELPEAFQKIYNQQSRLSERQHYGTPQFVLTPGEALLRACEIAVATLGHCAVVEWGTLSGAFIRTVHGAVDGLLVVRRATVNALPSG